MAGVTVDELCAIYRTQFPVLAGYDRGQYVYDANGRLVPTSIANAVRQGGDHIPQEQRIAMHPGSGTVYVYETPFCTFDREFDLRSAYAAFEQRLASVS